MMIRTGFVLAVAAMLSGCDLASVQSKSAPPPVPPVAQKAPAPIAPAGLPGQGNAVQPSAVQPSAVQPRAELPTGPDPSMVKAGVGVGKAGSSLKNETGILVEPAKSLFAVKERVVFNFEIPKALDLFKATEGRAPKSHQEFMDKIITSNNIRLPKLPTGKEYVFDPQRGELMVKSTGP